MKKLSEIMKAPQQVNVDAGAQQVWQSLILFDGVLDGNKIIKSEEVNRLLTFFYGQPHLSLVDTNISKELHTWLRDEMYLADVNCRVKIYPFKADFEDFAVKAHSEEYSGPLCIQVFKPKEALENEILVLTCRWNDNLFLNDYYVIGVIADNDDLATIIDEYLRQD